MSQLLRSVLRNTCRRKEVWLNGRSNERRMCVGCSDGLFPPAAAERESGDFSMADVDALV